MVLQNSSSVLVIWNIVFLQCILDLEILPLSLPHISRVGVFWGVFLLYLWGFFWYFRKNLCVCVCVSLVCSVGPACWWLGPWGENVFLRRGGFITGQLMSSRSGYTWKVELNELHFRYYHIHKLNGSQLQEMIFSEKKKASVFARRYLN